VVNVPSGAIIELGEQRTRWAPNSVSTGCRSRRRWPRSAVPV